MCIPKLSFVLLSAHGKPCIPLEGKVDPDINMKTSATKQVVYMDAATCFKPLLTP